MVTATTGTLRFKGLRTGNEYVYSSYISDVVAAFTTWNRGGTAVAGSVNFVTAPEDMVLVDASFITGPTVMTLLQLVIDDGNVPGAIIQFANVVNTLTSRSFPRLGISKGRKVQLVQA